jgi:hypothetical protein
VCVRRVIISAVRRCLTVVLLCSCDIAYASASSTLAKRAQTLASKGEDLAFVGALCRAELCENVPAETLASWAIALVTGIGLDEVGFVFCWCGDVCSDHTTHTRCAVYSQSPSLSLPPQDDMLAPRLGFDSLSSVLDVLSHTPAGRAAYGNRCRKRIVDVVTTRLARVYARCHTPTLVSLLQLTHTLASHFPPLAPASATPPDALIPHLTHTSPTVRSAAARAIVACYPRGTWPQWVTPALHAVVDDVTTGVREMRGRTGSDTRGTELTGWMKDTWGGGAANVETWWVRFEGLVELVVRLLTGQSGVVARVPVRAMAEWVRRVVAVDAQVVLETGGGENAGRISSEALYALLPRMHARALRVAEALLVGMRGAAQGISGDMSVVIQRALREGRRSGADGGREWVGDAPSEGATSGDSLWESVHVAAYRAAVALVRTGAVLTSAAPVCALAACDLRLSRPSGASQSAAAAGDAAVATARASRKGNKRARRRRVATSAAIAAKAVATARVGGPRVACVNAGLVAAACEFLRWMLVYAVASVPLDVRRVMETTLLMTLRLPEITRLECIPQAVVRAHASVLTASVLAPCAALNTADVSYARSSVLPQAVFVLRQGVSLRDATTADHFRACLQSLHACMHPRAPPLPRPRAILSGAAAAAAAAAVGGTASLTASDYSHSTAPTGGGGFGTSGAAQFFSTSSFGSKSAPAEVQSTAATGKDPVSEEADSGGVVGVGGTKRRREVTAGDEPDAPVESPTKKVHREASGGETESVSEVRVETDAAQASGGVNATADAQAAPGVFGTSGIRAVVTSETTEGADVAKTPKEATVSKKRSEPPTTTPFEGMPEVGRGDMPALVVDGGPDSDDDLGSLDEDSL